MPSRVFLKKLFNLSGPTGRRYIFIAASVGVLVFLIEAATVVIVQGFLLSLGLLSSDSVYIPSWYPSELLHTAGLLVSVGGIKALALYCKNYIKLRYANSFVRHQRMKLFNYAMNSHREESTQSLAVTFTETVSRSSVFMSNLTCFLTALVSAVLLVIACCQVAPRETLLGLVAAVLFYFPLGKISDEVSRIGRESNGELREISKTLLSSFKNFFFLKLSNVIDLVRRDMDSQLESYEKKMDRYASFSAIKGSLPAFIGLISVAIISIMSRKYFDTAPSVLLTFFYLFMRAGNNVSEVTSTLVLLRFNKPYLDNLLSMNEKLERCQLADQAFHSERDTFKSLSFENVHFAYPQGDKVFEGLSFSLNTGEILLVKGESGAGKSTLISLMLGVLSPGAGRVLLNGSEKHLLQRLSSNVGYISSEPFLVTGSVRENLLYGLPREQALAISDESIWAALGMSQVADLILGFPKRLDEQLHEHIQVSTGQRQRISIARALLKKPSLLIMDEATANLDKQTEKNILQEIFKLKEQGLSIVVISHQMTFDHCYDQLLQLEGKGKVRYETSRDHVTRCQ